MKRVVKNFAVEPWNRHLIASHEKLGRAGLLKNMLDTGSGPQDEAIRDVLSSEQKRMEEEGLAHLQKLEAEEQQEALLPRKRFSRS